jgi:hypothetical protein
MVNKTYTARQRWFGWVGALRCVQRTVYNQPSSSSTQDTLRKLRSVRGGPHLCVPPVTSTLKNRILPSTKPNHPKVVLVVPSFLGTSPYSVYPSPSVPSESLVFLTPLPKAPNFTGPLTPLFFSKEVTRVGTEFEVPCCHPPRDEVIFVVLVYEIFGSKSNVS